MDINSRYLFYQEWNWHWKLFFLLSQHQLVNKKSKFQSNNIGWNYPTDQTLKPTANLPEIVEINPPSFEELALQHLA